MSDSDGEMYADPEITASLTGMAPKETSPDKPKEGWLQRRRNRSGSTEPKAERDNPLSDKGFIIIGTVLALVGGALCYTNPANMTFFWPGLLVGTVGALGALKQDDLSVANFLPTAIIVLGGLILPHIVAQ